MKSYAVYIMASGRNSTLYIGFNSNLERRVYEQENPDLVDLADDF